jgi:hypothetical protein
VLAGTKTARSSSQNVSCFLATPAERLLPRLHAWQTCMGLVGLFEYQLGVARGCLNRRPSSASAGLGGWYSAPVTWAPQRAAPSVTDRWVMKCSGAAPCQCSSPSGVDDVAGPDLGGLPAAGLDQAAAFGDVEGLASFVGVPAVRARG